MKRKAREARRRHQVSAAVRALVGRLGGQIAGQHARFAFAVTFPAGHDLPDHVNLGDHPEWLTVIDGRLALRFPAPFADVVIFHGEMPSLEKAVAVKRAVMHFLPAPAPVQ